MPSVSLDHVELHYELVAGSDERPVLVFLHEGLGCGAMWKDFPQRLCAATACPGLVYDRQGYGRSGPQRGARSIHYLHQYALQELPAVLAALIPGRPHIVVGHSDGGSIALIYAAGQPAGLRGVATVAAHVFVEEMTLDGIRQALRAHGAGKLRGLARYHGAKADTVFSSWAETWLAAPFAHWNIEYLLPAIACPLLAAQGSADQYGSARQLQAIAGQVQQGRQLLLPGCGHSPHLEQPDALAQALAAFINPLAA